MSDETSEEALVADIVDAAMGGGDPGTDDLLLARLEQAILEHSAQGMLGAVMAADVIEETEDGEQRPMRSPPPEWILKYGAQRARRMFVAAAAAWSTKSKAPAFLQLQRELFLGIANVRTKRQFANQIQVNMVAMMPPPRMQYEEISANGHPVAAVGTVGPEPAHGAEGDPVPAKRGGVRKPAHDGDRYPVRPGPPRHLAPGGAAGGTDK